MHMAATENCTRVAFAFGISSAACIAALLWLVSPARAENITPTEVTTGGSRSYLMGFSTFVSDLDVGAISKGYELSNKYSDMRLVQLDAGVPWVEMDRNEKIPQRIIDDWDYTRGQSASKKFFVAITSRDFEGTGLALYAAQQGNNQPLPAGWAARTQDDEKVKQAYLRYAEEVVNFWRPDFIAISIEANVVANKNLTVWRQYLELHRFVYERLKEKHPDLKIFATIEVEHFKGLKPDAKGKTDLQRKIVKELAPYQDLMALSVYPYSVNESGLPPGYFEEFKIYQKPLAIAETGWPAADFTMFGKTTSGSEAAQARYLDAVLKEAGKEKFVFVINWVSVDYVRLLEKLPKSDAMEFSNMWVHNGMWDLDFKPRKALAVWEKYFRLKVN